MRICGQSVSFRVRPTICLRGLAISKGAIVGLAFCGLVACTTTATGADVLTQRGSNERTGAYVDPTINQQLVADRSRWGLVGKLPIHGSIYAQPLFVKNFQLPGIGVRNVVLVASALNNVAAFDAGTLAPLWRGPINLGPNDKSKTGHDGCDGISDNFSGEGIGIEATPVIDRARNRMIVSYRTNPTGQLADARQRLGIIDLATGHQRSIEVESPTGLPDWHIWHRSRASLLLLNDVIYVAFGSRCEDPGTPAFHGWIIALAADSFLEVGAFSPTNGNSAFVNTVDGGGIWQGSHGLAADTAGDIYFMTGNRRLGNCKPAPCDAFPPDESNIADSIVRVRPLSFRDKQTRQIVRVEMDALDWFTPYRKIWLDHEDLDLGSAGPIVLPGTNFLVGGGKQGVMYLMDRRAMGKFDATPPFNFAELGKLGPFATYDGHPDDPGRDHVVQKFQAGINQYISGMHSSPGAPMAVARQNDHQIDAFIVGSDGSIWVTWETNDGPWSDWFPQPPAQITPNGFAPAGAHLAAAGQNDHQLDVFVVGNDGAVWVTWETNDGRWTDGAGGQPGPARITPTGLAPPGACITAIKQNDHQLDAFVVGNDGAIHVTWEINDGRWADGEGGQPGPARITPPNLAPPGSCVAAALQNDHQLDAFVVGNDGAIHVTWEINDGRWADGAGGQPGPARITPIGLAPPGAGVSAILQNNHQLDAFVVGNDGAIHVTWEVNDGRWTDGDGGQPGPARITPAGLAAPGSCVAAAEQNDHQFDAFTMGNDGAIHVAWEIDDGLWTDGLGGRPGPARITPTTLAPPRACVVAIKQNDHQLNAFTVSRAGAIFVTWEVNDGRWADGDPGAPPPARLTPTLRMHEWIHWPHIHGSPVFAEFSGAGSFLYVWPEKDHLKAFPWLGNRFDTVNRILGRGLDGQFVLTPPGPPFGMPGGMLAASVNPTMPRSGVLFASHARTFDQTKGLLRAFDPITLRELWNNAGEDYRFAKFVAPMIADGRVYLPTAGALGHPPAPNHVLVYGARH